MVCELYDMFNAMDKAISGLVCSGNGIRKNYHLRALASKRFGTDVMIPVHMEEAAFGAALFGAICAGVFLDSNQAQSLISYI